MTDDGIAKTPEEMAAKVAADQKTDMSGHTPKRNVPEGGPGNAYTGPTIRTGSVPMPFLHRGRR